MVIGVGVVVAAIGLEPASVAAAFAKRRRKTETCPYKVNTTVCLSASRSPMMKCSERPRP